jgi:uncharacterized protein (DUF1800 family)
VRVPRLMYEQNARLRRHALGNYRLLVHYMAKDPAMIRYLDNQSNRKGKPNENFARELLELFTLGEGHYTEQDIKEGARAFTGWMAVPRGGSVAFVFNPRQHDYGEKTFLGLTGDLNGGDAIDRILEQPRAAEYIVEKLWREFVSPAPDPAEVKRLAAVFRNEHYEIKPLLRALLLASAFSDPANRGTLVKSPVELMVGTARAFGIPVEKPAILAVAGRRMGQDLLDPPTVKGWAGGEAWIDSNTLLARRQFAERVARGREMEAIPENPNRDGTKAPRAPRRMAGRVPLERSDWLTGMDRDMTDPAERARMEALLVATPPVTPPPAPATARDVALALMLDPAYQLK